MDCIIDLLRALGEDVFMERRSLLEEAPKPFVEIVWIHAATPFPLSVSELEASAATLFSRYSTRRTLRHDTVFRSSFFFRFANPRTSATA